MTNKIKGMNFGPQSLTKGVTIGFRADFEIKRKIQKLAKQNGVSEARIIHTILEDYLKGVNIS